MDMMVCFLITNDLVLHSKLTQLFIVVVNVELLQCHKSNNGSALLTGAGFATNMTYNPIIGLIGACGVVQNL